MTGLTFIDDTQQAGGLPFQVITPERKHHMVTSAQHLEDINRAPVDVLSLHAVAKDVSVHAHLMFMSSNSSIISFYSRKTL